MIYQYIHEVFIDLHILNAQYLRESEDTELKQAVSNKIGYLVQKISGWYNEIYNDYRNGKVFPFQYDTYLKGYASVLDNNTGLDCYQHSQLDALRNEIAFRIKS